MTSIKTSRGYFGWKNEHMVHGASLFVISPGRQPHRVAIVLTLYSPFVGFYVRCDGWVGLHWVNCNANLLWPSNATSTSSHIESHWYSSEVMLLQTVETTEQSWEATWPCAPLSPYNTSASRKPLGAIRITSNNACPNSSNTLHLSDGTFKSELCKHSLHNSALSLLI